MSEDPEKPDRTRGYEPGVPVMATVYLAGGVDLLAEPEYKAMLTGLLAKATRRANVDLWSYDILDNHLHLGLIQYLDKGVSSLTEGIGPCVRNAISPYARSVNARGRGDGHVVSKPYHHTHLRTVEDVVRAIAYINHQAERHNVPAKLAAHWLSSWTAIQERTPDGVCTALPSVESSCLTEEELQAQFAAMLTGIAEEASAECRATIDKPRRRRKRPKANPNRAKKLARREAHAQARLRTQERARIWARITRRVLVEHGIDGSAPSTRVRFTPCPSINDAIHQARRDAQVAYRLPRRFHLVPVVRRVKGVRRVVAMEFHRPAARGEPPGLTTSISMIPRPTPGR